MRSRKQSPWIKIVWFILGVVGGEALAWTHMDRTVVAKQDFASGYIMGYKDSKDNMPNYMESGYGR